VRLTWKNKLAKIDETFPRSSFSVLMFDKFTSVGGADPLGKGDRKDGSNASPGKNVAGNESGVERKSACPKSQSSDQSKI